MLGAALVAGSLAVGGVASADQGRPAPVEASRSAGLAKGIANEVFASGPGKYEVAATKVSGDCRGLIGVLAKLAADDGGLRCSDAFPYGFSSPVSTTVYYPDSDEDRTYPVVDFVGGIFSNEAQYETLMRHWASQGFVVAASTNFINSFPTMHVLGALEARRLNDDPASPLHNKVDLGRTIVAGHSAGGAATMQTASFTQGQLGLIDPDLRVVGAMPIEPGPVALGSTIKAPTLLLTGGQDTTVPAWAWPALTQRNLIKDVPAWSATADTATHFSPLQSRLDDNEFAGASTAFLLYLTSSNADARAYFTGADYQLATDEQYRTSPLSPVRVQRNELAENL